MNIIAARVSSVVKDVGIEFPGALRDIHCLKQHCIGRALEINVEELPDVQIKEWAGEFKLSGVRDVGVIVEKQNSESKICTTQLLRVNQYRRIHIASVGIPKKTSFCDRSAVSATGVSLCISDDFRWSIVPN